MTVRAAVAKSRADTPRTTARSGRMRSIATAIVMMASGCLGTRADLNPGDPVPALMQLNGRITVMLTATVDDCLSCALRDVFVAVRTLQARRSGNPKPEVLVLAVAHETRDTLVFRRTLTQERVTARIQRIVPRDAASIMDLDKQPAMYLINDGRIIQEWEPSANRRVLIIQRSELVGAVTGMGRTTSRGMPDSTGASGRR